MTAKEIKYIAKALKSFKVTSYGQREKEYEYQNSDECVDENITNNDYTFLADGTRED